MVTNRSTRAMRPACAQKIVDAAHRYPTAPGPQLGSLCYKARVPAAFIAQILGTTEQTVYRWFYHHVEIRDPAHVKFVGKLIKALRYAIARNLLPVAGDYGRIEEKLTEAIKALQQEQKAH